MQIRDAAKVGNQKKNYTLLHTTRVRVNNNVRIRNRLLPMKFLFMLKN